MHLEEEARQLVQSLSGRMGPSPYDIAWMARVPADSGDGVRWPDLLDWLIEHQWPDDSWGGVIPYYHDRILCTLAAIIALKERGTRMGDFRAIQRGERYIWRNLHFLHHDPIELVGFELLLPTLLARAHALDLDVPAHSGNYGRIRAAKLRLLPAELLYTPGTSTAFSLEFLDTRGDPSCLCQLQGRNGSIANSPSATAYVLLQSGENQEALDYLDRMRAQPGGIPHFHPLRTFEVTWVLKHLAFGGLSLDGLVEPAIWKELQSVLREKGGVSMDPAFGIPDGDTTAVTLHILALGGQPVDPMVLHQFEEPETRTFRTLAFERNASVGTNVHALEALSLMPDYPDRQEVWDHVVAMLLDAQIYRSYWVDKWHASPYYATSHVLIALINAQEPMLAKCLHSIEWLLHSQRDDGSWGYFDRGTAEETAYALLALLHYQRQVEAVDTEVLRRGMACLCRMVQEGLPYPELWIAKSLYAPEGMIGAAILAAMILYQETFGHVPD